MSQGKRRRRRRPRTWRIFMVNPTIAAEAVKIVKQAGAKGIAAAQLEQKMRQRHGFGAGSLTLVLEGSHKLQSPDCCVGVSRQGRVTLAREW